jgi:transposase-like protein
MRCHKCQSERIVKNGSKYKGIPYYKCKDCGTQFNRNHGKKGKLKAMAVALYCTGLSLRTIGALLGYSDVAILNWVREFARENYHKPIPKGDIILELDEMWHYLDQKKTNCGFGKHIVAQLDNLLTGSVVIEAPTLLKGCIKD